MRILWVLLVFSVVVPGWGTPGAGPAPPPDPPLVLDPPVVLDHGLWDSLDEPTRLTWEWATVAVGGVGGVGMAFWGLGTALAHLSDPGGPPLGATVTGLAWSTLGLAAAGVALDALLNEQ